MEVFLEIFPQKAVNVRGIIALLIIKTWSLGEGL